MDTVPPLTAPAVLAQWWGELSRVLLGLVEAYVPGSPGITARTREQVIISVSEVNGDRYSVWVHGSWLDFIGNRDPEEELLPLFEYARSCAEAGRPLDTTTLDAVYPPAVVRSLRATVARTSLVNAVGTSVDDLLERLFGHRELDTVAVLRDAALLAGAIPVIAPVMGAAAFMRFFAKVAPSIPDVVLPPGEQSSLVVHLVAEAVPTYLGNTLLRTGALMSPVTIGIGVRMEGSAATMRVGRGRVAVVEGITRDAIVILDGGIEPLLRVVASSIVRELSPPRPLRRRG